MTNKQIDAEMDRLSSDLATLLCASTAHLMTGEFLKLFLMSVLRKVRGLEAAAANAVADVDTTNPALISAIHAAATPITPETLEWARNQFSEKEIIEGLHELRLTGGRELSEFVAELDDLVASNTRSP